MIRKKLINSNRNRPIRTYVSVQAVYVCCYYRISRIISDFSDNDIGTEK